MIGDGSSLYGIQGLWSAAHYRAGVLYVILSNGGYAIMDRLAERTGEDGPGRASRRSRSPLSRSASAVPRSRISTTHDELLGRARRGDSDACPAHGAARARRGDRTHG